MSAQQVLKLLMLTPQSSIERAKSIRAVCFQRSSDLQAALSSSAPPAPLSGFDVPQVPLSLFFNVSPPHLLIRLFCISSSHHLKMCPSRWSSIFAFFFFSKKKKTKTKPFKSTRVTVSCPNLFLAFSISLLHTFRIPSKSCSKRR